MVFLPGAQPIVGMVIVGLRVFYRFFLTSMYFLRTAPKLFLETQISYTPCGHKAHFLLCNFDIVSLFLLFHLK